MDRISIDIDITDAISQEGPRKKTSHLFPHPISNKSKRRDLDAFIADYWLESPSPRASQLIVLCVRDFLRVWYSRIRGMQTMSKQAIALDVRRRRRWPW